MQINDVNCETSKLTATIKIQNRYNEAMEDEITRDLNKVLESDEFILKTRSLAQCWVGKRIKRHAYNLHNFISKVIKREFQFDRNFIEFLSSHMQYDKCPHIVVDMDEYISFAKNPKKLTEIGVKLIFCPSGQESELLIVNSLKNSKRHCNSQRFYTDVRYENITSKSLEDSNVFKNNMRHRKSTEVKERLEIQICQVIHKDDEMKSKPIGTACISMDVAILYDGKTSVPVYNEFGNHVGAVSITTTFVNQHMPLAGDEISNAVCSKVLKDFVNILDKWTTHHSYMLTSIKGHTHFRFCDKLIPSSKENPNYFYVEATYAKTETTEFRIPAAAEEVLDHDNSFVIYLYASGNPIFEFGKGNIATTYPIKNSLSEQLELRVYKIIPNKVRSRSISQHKGNLLSVLEPGIFSPSGRSLPSIPNTLEGTKANAALSSSSYQSTSSLNSVSNTIQQQCANLSESQTLTIVSSCDSLHSTGTKKKNKKSYYQLVFKTKLEIGDISWKKGGLDITYVDDELSYLFKWHLELLHSTCMPTKSTKEVEKHEIVYNLLLVTYYMEIRNLIISKQNLSNWNGTLCRESQNMLAIIMPHFRSMQWKAMIAWTLLKLHPLFTTINENLINEYSQVLNLNNPSPKEYLLIDKYKTFCLEQISNFDITISTLGPLNAADYLKGLFGGLMISNPEINETLKNEWRRAIKQTLFMKFHQNKKCDVCIISKVQCINRSLEGYALSNLNFITNNVDTRFGRDLWCPIFAQSTLDVVLLMFQNERSHLVINGEVDTSLIDLDGYRKFGELTFRLYKHIKLLLKIGRFGEDSQQFKQFCCVFEPCLRVWANNCAKKAHEQIHIVVKLEENKDLRFDSWDSFAQFDAMQGAIEVKGIFYTAADLTWKEINWLRPGKSLQFGMDLYKKLYEVFQSYIHELHAMVLRDNEFWPHELNYVIKSMFHSVSFLDNFWETIQDELNVANNSAIRNSTLLRTNSTTENTRNEIKILRDEMINAFCKGQEYHLKHFLAYLKHPDQDQKDIYERIIQNDYSFNGYIYGLLSYFERSLQQDVKDENVMLQLITCNRILKETLLAVGENVLRQYCAEIFKCSCDKRMYTDLLTITNAIKELRMQFHITTNTCCIDELRDEINLKISNTRYLVSTYLEAYCSMVKQKSSSQISPLKCFGEICYNAGIMDNHLYVSLRSVNNIAPRPRSSTCNFSIQVLLLPTIDNGSDCITAKGTRVVNNKTNHLFDIATPSKVSRGPFWPFTGATKNVQNFEDYTFDFVLDKTSNWSQKFLELQLYDHTFATKYFRGHIVLPLTDSNVSNINVLEDFLYGCNEKYKIHGQFTQYLEPCNETGSKMEKVFYELDFRKNDVVANNFVKNRNRLSPNYMKIS